MRTEHLQNVHLGWVTAGWFIAAAATSLIILGLAGLGVVGPGGTTVGTTWSVVAVGIGFFVGGMFTGFLSTDAPILHGIAIGIFSLVAWLGINVVVSLAFPDAGWAALTPIGTAVVLLLQMAAAIAGALTGRAIEMSGGPDVTE